MDINKEENERKFIETLEQSMKGGYINMLILLALEKGPANGYRLMKMISEDTFGEWRPTNSTMYPYLSNLTNRGLVQYKIKKQGQRESKEYYLTTKGTNILKKLVEKQQEMNITLLNIGSSVTGLDLNHLPHHLTEFFTKSYEELILMGKSNEDKIKILSRRVDVFNLFLDIIGNVKNEMEIKLKMLKSNEFKDSYDS